jgi:AraC family transcriptional regulator
VRVSLLNSSIGLVEDVAPTRAHQNGGFSPDFQVALPYRGVFIWHVAGDSVIGDSGHVLFVTAGEPYRVLMAHDAGYRELIITPSIALLAELTALRESTLSKHPMFRHRSRNASRQLSILRTRLLRCAMAIDERDQLSTEEATIDLLRAAFDLRADDSIAFSTRRLIRRTKEFVNAMASERFQLRDIADAVGASPMYISHMFHRLEGMTLHEYVKRLRLTRALQDLPHADDLTTLAIDAGFSSHSHFTAVFRRTFGLTPSQFRQTVGRRALPADSRADSAEVTSAKAGDSLPGFARR